MSPISNLPLLTTAEKHRLLVEWNDTQKAYPKDQCIHQLFELQVERSPEAIAVVFEGRQLTYRRLNELANKIGSLLVERGFGAGSYVPILMDRNSNVAVAMLAAMKAGAAFVPVDIR